MPVRNGERYLAEAIESVLTQTLAELELVVVDDGSTDRSAEIVSSAAARDSRVRLYSQDPLGLCAALNRAADVARAPLLARLDADDVALPERLERQVAFLAQNPAVAVVGGGVIVIDQNGIELDCEPGPERVDLSKGNALSHPSVTMRADALRRIGGYRLYPAEDFDLWLRLEEHHQLAALPDLVVKHRLHLEQVSIRSFENQALTALAASAAARQRRAGHPDPLGGVTDVSTALLEELGIGGAEAQEAVVSAAVEWATALVRAGRVAAATTLLTEIGTRAGWPSVRSLRLAVELRLVRRAIHRRRSRDVARSVARIASILPSRPRAR